MAKPGSRFINIIPNVEYDGQGNPIYDDTTVGGLPQTASNQKYQQILDTERIRHDQIEKVSSKIGDTDFFICKDDNILG